MNHTYVLTQPLTLSGVTRKIVGGVRQAYINYRNAERRRKTPAFGFIDMSNPVNATAVKQLGITKTQWRADYI